MTVSQLMGRSLQSPDKGHICFKNDDSLASIQDNILNIHCKEHHHAAIQNDQFDLFSKSVEEKYNLKDVDYNNISRNERNFLLEKLMEKDDVVVFARGNESK